MCLDPGRKEERKDEHLRQKPVFQECGVTFKDTNYISYFSISVMKYYDQNQFLKKVLF